MFDASFAAVVANPCRVLVFLPDQPLRPLAWPFEQRARRGPSLLQAVAKIVRRCAEVHQERLVVSAGAVFRLTARRTQVASHASQVKAVEKRAVMQQEPLFPLLGVAGKFSAC